MRIVNGYLGDIGINFNFGFNEGVVSHDDYQESDPFCLDALTLKELAVLGKDALSPIDKFNFFLKKQNLEFSKDQFWQNIFGSIAMKLRNRTLLRCWME